VSRDAAGNLISIDDKRFDPVFRFIQDQGKPWWDILGNQKTAGCPWIP
jgi:hypothetical protein